MSLSIFDDSDDILIKFNVFGTSNKVLLHSSSQLQVNVQRALLRIIHHVGLVADVSGCFTVGNFMRSCVAAVRQIRDDNELLR